MFWLSAHLTLLCAPLPLFPSSTGCWAVMAMERKVRNCMTSTPSPLQQGGRQKIKLKAEADTWLNEIGPLIVWADWELRWHLGGMCIWTHLCLSFLHAHMCRSVLQQSLSLSPSLLCHKTHPRAHRGHWQKWPPLWIRSFTTAAHPNAPFCSYFGLQKGYVVSRGCQLHPSSG